MDVFEPEKRSWIMARIGNRDTKPEIQVRSIVHRMGYRFRKNRNDLPGRPDIVFPSLRKIIFVHGCFWHGHEACKRSARPTSNREFWQKKLDANISRDRKNVSELRKRGWKVLIIWQCSLKNENALFQMIKNFLVMK